MGEHQDCDDDVANKMQCGGRGADDPGADREAVHFESGVRGKEGLEGQRTAIRRVESVSINYDSRKETRKRADRFRRSALLLFGQVVLFGLPFADAASDFHLFRWHRALPSVFFY